MLLTGFDESILSSILGGLSAIDIPHLTLTSAEEASEFIKSYGYDLENPEDLKKLWYFHRRALVLIQEKLLIDGESVPLDIADPKILGDLRRLLLLASDRSTENKELQRWACATLRVMHVFVHAENDLFSFFAEEIQKQILTPLENCIRFEGSPAHPVFRCPQRGNEGALSLHGFETKSFKMSSSTVIKLLAKSDMLAMKIYDKIGVRFITRTLTDTFLVLKLLIDENLISFPHVMPDQSSNTIYPVDLFLEEIKKAEALGLSNEELDSHFKKILEDEKHNMQFVRKENTFSGGNYRFIKFIARKLVHIPWDDGRIQQLSFFYPFEVQIMDLDSYRKNARGAESHDQYKLRQKNAARRRVFLTRAGEG